MLSRSRIVASGSPLTASTILRAKFSSDASKSSESGPAAPFALKPCRHRWHRRESPSRMPAVALRIAAGQHPRVHHGTPCVSGCSLLIRYSIPSRSSTRSQMRVSGSLDPCAPVLVHATTRVGDLLHDLCEPNTHRFGRVGGRLLDIECPQVIEGVRDVHLYRGELGSSSRRRSRNHVPSSDRVGGLDTRRTPAGYGAPPRHQPVPCQPPTSSRCGGE